MIGMFLFIFIILGLLMLLEASSSLIRAEGYRLARPDASMTLVNAVNIGSRTLVALLLPGIGLIADLGYAPLAWYEITLFQCVIPIGVGLAIISRNFLTRLAHGRLLGLMKSGSLFFKSHSHTVRKGSDEARKRKIRWKLFSKFYLFFAFAYLPHYLIWTLLILVLPHFPDYRATIIALTSVFNGANTLLVTLYFDPAIVGYARRRRVIPGILEDMMLARLVSGLMSVVSIGLISFLIDNAI